MKERFIVSDVPEEDDEFQIPKEYKKIFLKECPIAGLSFHLEKDDDLWFELSEGTKMALVRDRNNKHDRNAVAVTLADDYEGDPNDFDFELILGYIPRDDNAEIAAMLDAGYADKLSAEITTLHQYGSYNNRIRITICIESREPIAIRPDLLRAQWLDDDSYDKMNAELKDRGFATFHWGGVAIAEHHFPEPGDKIVIFREQNDQIDLHLMHVLAKGEECLKLGVNSYEITADKDSTLFALTNVAGPLSLSRDSLKFLLDPRLQDNSVCNYLSPGKTDALKRLFGITHAIKKPQ